MNLVLRGKDANSPAGPRASFGATRYNHLCMSRSRSFRSTSSRVIWYTVGMVTQTQTTDTTKSSTARMFSVFKLSVEHFWSYQSHAHIYSP